MSSETEEPWIPEEFRPLAQFYRSELESHASGRVAPVSPSMGVWMAFAWHRANFTKSQMDQQFEEWPDYPLQKSEDRVLVRVKIMGQGLKTRIGVKN